MVMINDYTQKLVRLGYSQDAANFLVASHLSRGMADELKSVIDSAERGENAGIYE